MPDSSSSPWLKEQQRGRGLFLATAPALVLTFTVFFAGLSRGNGPIELPFAFADKIQHAVGFFIVAYAYFRALRAWWPQRSSTLTQRGAWLLATLVGALLELAQAFVPYRTAEWLDLVADAVGALAGSLAAAWLARQARVGGSSSSA